MIGIDAARLIAAVVESGMGEVELCVTAGVGHQTFAKMARGPDGALPVNRKNLQSA